MPVRKDLRKSQFKAALALAGLTQTQWAASLDLSPEHVSMVLNGRRESRKLLSQIEEFTREHINRRTTALAS